MHTLPVVTSYFLNLVNFGLTYRLHTFIQINYRSKKSPQDCNHPLNHYPITYRILTGLIVVRNTGCDRACQCCRVYF